MDAIANLSGYQITEQLYAGTRTLVYRGIRTRDQYPVVIKLLRNEYPTSDGVTGCLKNRQGGNSRQIASKKIG